MAISDQLTLLNNTKTAIRTAINNKGGSVEASAPFASYATAIQNLPSGGSGNPLLTSIDVSDFSGTTFNRATSYITDVTIPSGVTTIGQYAFQSCTGLTSINIPNSVTTIQANAFYECSGLTGNLDIKWNAGDRAFYNCTGLTSLTFPYGSVSLDYAVFDGCTSVTSVNVDNLETWLDLTFTNVQNFPYGNPISLPQKPALNVNGTVLSGELSIPNTVTSIKNGAFVGYDRITSLVMPNTVTSIGNYAFNECTGLTSVTVGSGVTTIGKYAFQSCTSLTSVDIPDSVATIGEYAFSQIKSPVKVTIGSGITRIETGAFQNVGANGSVTIKKTTPPTLGGGYVFWGSYPIYVPAESVDTYKAASGWSTYASRIFAIEDAITFTPTNGDPAISVKNYELATANYVQSTDVPSTIKNGAGALEICEGVTHIGRSAFQNGTSLTSATLPSTLTRIDETVFDGCSGLTSVTVNATTPPTLYGSAFGGSYPIYVPAESVDAYKAANNWSTYASRIEAIPVQEHALFDAPPQTAVITEDPEDDYWWLTFPLKVYYSDGTEMTGTYHLPNGTVLYWSPQTELTGNIADPNGDLADTEPDGNVFTPVYDSVNGWTMKYDVGFCLNDPGDPSPLVGKTVTFSTPPTGMRLPADYAEVDGAWVKVRDQEFRSGSFTITMTGYEHT